MAWAPLSHITTHNYTKKSLITSIVTAMLKQRHSFCVYTLLSPILGWTWAAVECVSWLPMSIRNVWVQSSLHALESGAVTAWSAVSGSVSCFYFVFCPRWYPLVPPLSLSALWQLLLSCCWSHWHLIGVRRHKGKEGVERAALLHLSSTVSSSPLLIPKANNGTALVLSSPLLLWWE